MASSCARDHVVSLPGRRSDGAAGFVLPTLVPQCGHAKGHQPSGSAVTQYWAYVTVLTPTTPAPLDRTSTIVSECPPRSDPTSRIARLPAFGAVRTSRPLTGSR